MKKKNPRPQVAIIMGSDSDLPTMQDAVDILADFGVELEVQIVSAHRTPKYMQTYATKAKSEAYKSLLLGLEAPLICPEW